MKNILVVQLARLGDLLQTKRLILSVMAEKDARLHLLVDTSLGKIARLLYPSAEVHLIPAGREETSSLAEVFNLATKTLKELGGINFQKIYVLNNSPLSYAISSFFPEDRVCGYKVIDGQRTRSSWSKINSKFLIKRFEYPINLVDYWGYFHTSPIRPEKVNPIAQKANSGRVGVVLSGQVSRRSLTPEVLAQCLKAIFEAYKGPELVYIGSKSEEHLARKINRFLPRQMLQKIEDLTGKTSLADLPDIFKGFDNLLTPDTGLMHLGAHLGVPVQAFFLSSAWSFETGPYGLGHKVWQAFVPCSPCLETEPCNMNMACLELFKSKDFIEHLRGNFDSDWPENILGLVSSLDELGVIFKGVDGDDPHKKARDVKRTLVAEFLNGQGKLKALDSEGNFNPRLFVDYQTEPSDFELVRAMSSSFNEVLKDEDWIVRNDFIF